MFPTDNTIPFIDTTKELCVPGFLQHMLGVQQNACDGCLVTSRDTLTDMCTPLQSTTVQGMHTHLVLCMYMHFEVMYFEVISSSF